MQIAEGHEAEVQTVTLRVQRSDRERRMGIASDSRRAVRDWARQTYGWADPFTTTVSADADTLTITVRERESLR